MKLGHLLLNLRLLSSFQPLVDRGLSDTIFMSSCQLLAQSLVSLLGLNELLPAF